MSSGCISIGHATSIGIDTFLVCLWNHVVNIIVVVRLLTFMPLIFHLAQLVNNRIIHLNTSLITINVVEGLHMVLLLLGLANSGFTLLHKTFRCFCQKLRASKGILRGDGLMCMRSRMCGVPTRLQSVLSIPQLLLYRVTIARVALNGM